MFLLIVDACSKWPEIYEMINTTAGATVRIFEAVCGRYGFPEVLVSDNGGQFQSEMFKEFCSKYGIKHIFAPPYHPQSNGQAERFVDTFKRTMNKIQGLDKSRIELEYLLVLAVLPDSAMYI